MTDDIERIWIHKGPDHLGRYYYSVWERREGYMYRPLPGETDEFPVGYRREQYFFSDLIEYIARRRFNEWLERMGRPAESHAIDPTLDAIKAFEAVR